MDIEKKKLRFRFQKTEGARFVSHLDLVRTLGRTMSRAGIPAIKTNGFNPHPFLSIPCALSLGYESLCEMADIEVPPDYDEKLLPVAMNSCLPDDIRISDSYCDMLDGKYIAFADYTLRFEPGEGMTMSEAAAIVSRSPLIMLKKSKRSEEERDISELISSVKEIEGGLSLCLAAGNTVSLNPSLIVGAVIKYGNGSEPSNVRICRTEFRTEDGRIFR